MDRVREKPRDRVREAGPDSYHEVDWREREKRRYGDRRPNGRASMCEQADYGDQEYERRKGDTFPRMIRPNKDPEGRLPLPIHEEGRHMGIPKLFYETEREKDRRRYRDMDTQSERERARYKEDMRKNDMRRLGKHEGERRREREKEFDSEMKARKRESLPCINDHLAVRDRERDRRGRDGDRYRQREREGRYNSRETESFSDREYRVERHIDVDRNKKRDTKSEGDSDGDAGRERRRKDDSKTKHYRSEGDSDAQQMMDRMGERDRRREREAERRQETLPQRERETGYQDQYRDQERDRRYYSDRNAYLYPTGRRRYKEEERMRYLEQVEIEKREKRRRENREIDRSKHKPSAEITTGCDVDDDQKRVIKENVEDREEEVTSAIDEQKVEKRKEKEQEGMSVQREEENGESAAVKTKPKFRKMWLEPRTEGERKGKSLEEEYIERERARERYVQRYRAGQTTEEVEDPEREKKNCEERDRELEKPGEFMTVQEEERKTFEVETQETEEQIERENVKDNTEEIDREEGSEKGKYGSGENEEESEGESEVEIERVMSADDGFVTVSSGGDDAEEENFEDCKEFWDGRVGDVLSGQSKCMQHEIKNQTENENEDHKGKKAPLKVFCVIGQTIPRSKPTDHVDEEATGQHSDQDLQVEANVTYVNEPPEKDGYTEQDIERAMDDLTLSHKQDKDSCDTKREGGGSNEQPTRDVRSLEDQMIPPGESLEKDTQQPELPCNENGTDASETLQGEKEAKGDPVEIYIFDDPWETEERKRCATAPHLTWAKNVVKEILDPTAEKELTRGSVMHVDTQIITQTESKGDMDDLRERKELLEAAVELQGGMETESNEESEDDLLDPSSVRNTVSSEEEAESERVKHGAEKTDRMKEGVLSSSSFRDLWNGDSWIRRRGIRKTAEKHKEGEEDEGVGRDRRTRIFHESEEDDDELSLTWSEGDLRKGTGSLSRTRKRNSKYFTSQLYQEYSEVVLNREIQLSHSDSIARSRDPSPIRSSSSPNHSPKLPRRLPPPRPPPPLNPYTLSQENSFKSLVVPPQSINRPPSPRLSISPSSPSLWQDLPGVRTSTEFGKLTEDERRLQEVRFEVVTSEASYCRSLDIVVENFVMSKQLNVLLSSQDKNWLFSRLSDVVAISHSFLSQLEERVESDVLQFTLCDIIIKNCPRFRKVYVPYLTNQSYQDKTYQSLMDGNQEFRRVVEKLERNPVCQRLPLRSFLILPFQRITRLKLLVQNIVKRTASKTTDEVLAIKAMKLLEKMIQESNDSISQMKNIESLVFLNAKVDFECRTLPLISQSRRLVREGPTIELRDFSMKQNERSVYLHLFNDYLLVSLKKEGGRFTVIDHAPVAELRVENCMLKLHSLQKNLFRLHMVNQALLLRTETQADKLRWISALSRPYPEIDFGAVQDSPQVQCIRAYVAQQPDELSLEKADVLLVTQHSTDGWVEGIRLSDRQHGWAPDSHVETIVNDKTKKRNLLDTMKIATAAL
ncbi:Rho guanine nucleotide exchange factor 5 [Triplophysa tibetana]|uniref:Rho guanine nucleotide exchange factor 5 n=1 Tax=Triplophysa tibetana TaxID=1572043 RepID=A0A5A9N1U9_9TELE|nr:Rho guanine nucleotide exchange factor 5 [Triplophysa tibetana]